MAVLRVRAGWSATFLASLVFVSLPRESSGGERGTPWKLHVIDDSSRGADGVRLADANGDGLMDIATGWEEGGITRVYLNPGEPRAKGKWPVVTVGRTRSVEDAVLVDLDGDGATDVVSSCEGRTRTLFVHWAPRDRGQYLEPGRWKQEAIPASEGKMMWMFTVPVEVDGKNGIDLVAGGKGKGAEIGWFEAPEDPRSLDGYRWHPISNAGWIMSLIVRDMDGDGDLDVVTTDRRGAMRGCRWLENPLRGDTLRAAKHNDPQGLSGRRRESDPRHPQGVPIYQRWENHFIGGRAREVMFMTVADLDGDGLEDVLVAVKRASVLYLRRADAKGTSWKEREITFPANTGTAKGVAAGDIDGDGRLDIVFSCESADKGKSGVMWLSRTGRKPDTNWSPHEISGEVGIKFDRIELLDMDGDGDLDVLTCEERAGGKGLGVFWYENPHGERK